MEIKETQDQKTVMVRTTTSLEDISTTLGSIYGELMGYLQRNGLTMTGHPFVLYHNADMAALDIEAGVPVGAVVSGEGRIQPGTIPGGRVLSAIHTGPYSSLGETYTPVMEHIQKEGLEATEWMYELYLNSPGEVPEDQLQTEICFPLKA